MYLKFVKYFLMGRIHLVGTEEIINIRFGLVSLFNGISTLFRLFNAKAILLEEQ